MQFGKAHTLLMHTLLRHAKSLWNIALSRWRARQFSLLRACPDHHGRDNKRFWREMPRRAGCLHRVAWARPYVRWACALSCRKDWSIIGMQWSNSGALRLSPLERAGRIRLRLTPRALEYVTARLQRLEELESLKRLSPVSGDRQQLRPPLAVALEAGASQSLHLHIRSGGTAFRSERQGNLCRGPCYSARATLSRLSASKPVRVRQAQAK